MDRIRPILNSVFCRPEDILKNIVPVVAPDNRGSEERNYRYTHTNGRFFNIREMDATSFFLEEMTPNGRMFDENQERFWNEPILTEAKKNPNTFHATVKAKGLNPEHMVYVGGGLGLGSVYYDSLDKCATAIWDSIRKNSWYQYHDPKLAQKIMESKEFKENEIQVHAAYEQEKKEMATQGEGLFRGAHNIFGPLDKDAQKEILSYLNSPTEERWDKIYSKLITGSTTLWQAWCAVDMAAPRSKGSLSGGKWAAIPAPEVLREAIQAACQPERDKTGSSAEKADVVKLRP